MGVGQAEVEIATTAHTTLVVEAPGLGDEIQAIKAGILEIADVLVVNKADRPGADKTVQALEMMLEIEQPHSRQVRHHGQLIRVESPPRSQEADQWRVVVQKTVASTGGGVAELVALLDKHRHWLESSGEWAVRERLRAAHTLEGILRAELTRRILARMPHDGLDELVESLRRRDTDPYSAAAHLMAGW